MKRSFIKTGAAVLCAALALTTYGNVSNVLAYEEDNTTVVTTSDITPAPYDNTLTLEENNIDFMEIVRYYNYAQRHRSDFDDISYFELERDVQSYYIEYLSQQGLVTSEEDLQAIREFAVEIRNTEYDPNLSLQANLAQVYNDVHEVFLTYFRGWDGL